MKNVRKKMDQKKAKIKKYEQCTKMKSNSRKNCGLVKESISRKNHDFLEKKIIYRLHFTVWKFSNFPATLILREINFG